MEELTFVPAVEELISFYLKNKILGIPTYDDVIVDADMYGASMTPWEAFGNQLPWQPFVDEFGIRHHSCNFLYVFTPLRNVGKVGTKRKSRLAGKGCWSGNTRSKSIFDAEGKRAIGYCKSLTYETDHETQTLGQWTMMEYSINPEAHLELRGRNCDGLVLCKIKRDDIKCSAGGKVVSRNKSYTHPHRKKKPRLSLADEAVDSGQVVEVVDEVVDRGQVSEVIDEAVDSGHVAEVVDEGVDSGEVVVAGEVLDGVMMMMGEDCPNHNWPLVHDSQGEDFSNPNLFFDLDELLACVG